MLSPELHAAISSQLTLEAERLSEGRALPLSLEALLNELDIGLCFTVEAGKHGSLGFQRGRWVVRVNRESQQDVLSARERFTVAHELAHYLIEAHFCYRPDTRSNYWKLEALCNQFAEMLLVPRAVMERYSSSAPRSAVELAHTLQELCAYTNTSFEVSTRRLLPGLRNRALVAHLSWTSSEDIIIRWAAGHLAWIPGGRGKKLNKDHSLYSTLVSGRTLRARWGRPVRLADSADACLRRLSATEFQLFAISE
jgi:hypothetical protein